MPVPVVIASFEASTMPADVKGFLGSGACLHSRLEDEEDRTLGSLAEEGSDVAQGVARVRVRRIEAEEGLAVDRERHEARGVEEEGRRYPRGALVEEDVELLGEVAAGVELDDGEIRVGQREARPQEIAVERSWSRSQIR
jgi:hypothetical protein